MGIDLKSRDLAAFTLLYLTSVGILALVALFWYDHMGWKNLEFLGAIEFLLALLLGFLFARYALTPLAQRNQWLDRFLEDTLHELNIPIATIKANVQLLKRSATPSQERRLQRIEKAAQQLLDLYHELDHLIKEELDRIQPEEVELASLIQERIDLFKELLQGHRLLVDLEPTHLSLIRHEFLRAFDNLLSNAIKYSPQGSTITITLKRKILTIADEGKGIASQELVRIFDRYYRASKSQEGHGIGLDIVKRFCDRAGVAIRIESKPGQGTKVLLDFRSL